MYFRFIIFTILFWTFVLEASAQILKLDELISEALTKNPGQEASRQEMLSTKSQIGPKSAYEDPMLSFKAKDYPIDTLNRNEFGMTGNELGLSQKIPFPGKLSKIKKAATYEYEAKKEMVTQKQLEIIRDVKKAFYDLFFAYKKKVILTEEKNIFRSLIVVARNKYTLGKIPQSELLNFQIEETKLIEESLAVDRDIEVKLVHLNTLLGRTDKKAWLSGEPEELSKTSLDFSKMTFDEISEKAAQKNPSLKAAKSQVQSSKEMLSFAKWNYLPDIELMGAYTFRQPSPGDRGADFVSAGVGMTIPLWALGKQAEQVKSARADQARAKALLTQEQSFLLQGLKQTYEELKEANQKVELYESGLLPLTKQAISSARASYLSNRIEYLDLLKLVQNRFQTQTAYFNLLVQHESKIAELEALLGEPLKGEKK